MSLVPMPLRFRRVAHQAILLRPSQIAHRLLNVARRQARRRLPGLGGRLLDRRARAVPAWRDAPPPAGPVLWDPPTLRAQAQRLLTGRLCLLAHERAFAVPIDWHPAGVDYLWRYNLHYFEYLEALRHHVHEQPDRLPAVEALVAGWIDDWIHRYPYPRSPGWEPYAIAMRLIYWARALSDRPGLRSDALRRSVYRQILVLRANLERDLANNHTVENAVGLLFGTALLEPTPRLAGIADAAAGELRRQLADQLTDSGIQIERSAMYQSLLLSRLLMLRPLAQAGRVDLPELERWIAAMAAGLERYLLPDGSLAHFNDSAPGIAPPPTRLLAQAGPSEARRTVPRPSPAADQPDGIFRLEQGALCCLVDAEAPQPAHNPAHGHAALGSFVLTRQAAPLLIDPGCSTYEAGPQRAHERSTAAHNTLCLAGRNQSDVWDRFRVGRRARVLWRDWQQQERFASLAVRHDGYRPLGLLHTRRLMLFAEALIVADRLDAAPGRAAARGAPVSATSLLTFAPAVTLTGEGSMWTLRGGDVEAVLWLAAPLTAVAGVGTAAEVFGRTRPTATLQLQAPAQPGWQAMWAVAPPGMAVEFAPGAAAVRVGGQQLELIGPDLLPRLGAGWGVPC